MVMLPFFLFGFFINYYYGRYLIESMENKMSETVHQFAQNLENEIIGVSILSSALVHNPDFLRACSGYNDASAPKEIYYYQEELDFHLSNLFLYTNKIGSIYIFVKDRNPYQFKNYPAQNKMPETIQLDSLAYTEVEQKGNVIKIQNDLFHLFGENQEKNEPILSLLVNPEEKPYGENVTAVLFAFRVDLLKQLHKMDPQERKVILTDRDGNILLKNSSDETSQEILYQKEMKPENKKWVLTSARIPSADWYIIQAAERKILLSPLLKIRFIFNLILTGIIFIFILYTMLFFHNLITPINNLAEKMDLVEQGDYTVRMRLFGPDEIQHLQLSFNSMIEQVSLLTKEKEKHEKEKNRLELQALQYQINPHFIGNTLNAIRMMAVINKDEHIKNMTASLMRLVNDSFRGIGNCNRLEDETMSLTSYVHIMKVRFGNPIDLRFSIPEELSSALLRKMLLQPIVENSIIHGFQQRRKKGIILIQASRLNETLVLKVTDNGIGMDTKKQKAEIQGEDEGLTALGMNSVHRRIQLNFGMEYGLKIKSLEGFYASVTMNLPLKYIQEPV
jgi:two-component system sensor histidine kinase YesM